MTTTKSSERMNQQNMKNCRITVSPKNHVFWQRAKHWTHMKTHTWWHFMVSQFKIFRRYSYKGILRWSSAMHLDATISWNHNDMQLEDAKKTPCDIFSPQKLVDKLAQAMSKLLRWLPKPPTGQGKLINVCEHTTSLDPDEARTSESLAFPHC